MLVINLINVIKCLESLNIRFQCHFIEKHHLNQTYANQHIHPISTLKQKMEKYFFSTLL